jgi:hypothetical protein
VIIRICYLLLAAEIVLLPACKQDSSTAQAKESPPIVKRDSWKNAGCELITDAEIEQLLAFNGKNAFLNTRSLPDQVFCLRTWNKPDWKERETQNEKEGDQWLNPQNRLVVQLFDYTSAEHAKQQMEMLRRDRRATYEEDAPGIGDEGLWSTSTVTLLVRKDKYMLNIALEFDDKPHDNLNRAKQIAEIALKKL